MSPQVLLPLVGKLDCGMYDSCSYITHFYMFHLLQACCMGLTKKFGFADNNIYIYSPQLTI